jgi:hypothetical protein
VTSVDENSKLAALWRARERLEVALAPDENWQLLQGLARAGDRDREAASVEAKLLSNPVYRAWKNLNAAIQARQPDSANAAGLAPLAEAAPPHPSPAEANRGGDESNERRRRTARALAIEEEASVSFVARTPAPARREAPAGETSFAHWRSLQDGLAARTEEDGSGCKEAEVSVVSVDARRHATAVDRLLRALRGENQR